MTTGTGKRLYRACERCRRRKTRCELGTVGQPNKPPCVDCHRSGSECVLAGSRRGGNFRQRARSLLSEQRASAATRPRPNEGEDPSRPVASIPPEESQTQAIEENRDLDEEDSDQELSAELRNPSDALQILASTDKGPSNDPTMNLCLRQDRGPPRLVERSDRFMRTGSLSSSAAVAVEEHELLERGILSVETMLELLSIYKQQYHPFFPLAPVWLFSVNAAKEIGRRDFFLLTVILTISSRDRNDLSFIHKCCWEYTERLLLDIMLAKAWTQMPQTVEGLLLLSEWLPHPPSPTSSQHTEETSLSEDRTAWSLVGQAVRHAYLLKLDRAAFRGEGSSRDPEECRDHKRLIWTFLYIADRQISVRIGQSFWSRGPSLSSCFTAVDFPTLAPSRTQSLADVEENYALIHQANLELTQILHNAHDVLYSSRARTMALVFAGDYPRYIDDFQSATCAWHTKWSETPRTRPVKLSLLLLYEYVSVYINAFSFQAVLTRWSSNRLRKKARVRDHESNNAQTSCDTPLSGRSDGPFGSAIMTSPDGRYVFDALASAQNALKILSDMSPEELCPLPARYLLYGVYAAVFIYKAELADAIKRKADRQEADSLVWRFISACATTGANDKHVARHYSRMLQRMWRRKDSRYASNPVDLAAQQNDSIQLSASWGQCTSQSTPRDGKSTMGISQAMRKSSSGLDFQTPQLADPDIGLIDLQVLEGCSTQDFSAFLDPFQMAAMDQWSGGQEMDAGISWM